MNSFLLIFSGVSLVQGRIFFTGNSTAKARQGNTFFFIPAIRKQVLITREGFLDYITNQD